MTTRCSHCGSSPARLLPLNSCGWACFRAQLKTIRAQVAVYELSAGRDVVDIPSAHTAPGNPLQTSWCATCWAQGIVWEPVDGGLWPVPCTSCAGWGRE